MGDVKPKNNLDLDAALEVLISAKKILIVSKKEIIPYELVLSKDKA